MNAYKKYVDYLKDNPKGFWFKRKLYGWGWTPAKLEGWFVLIAYGAFIIWIASRLEGKEVTIESFFVPLTISTILLIWICYVKGEKPKWQWGKRVDD